MLVAISGSQGSGKSSVLKELSNRGYNVIERKTSRSILSDWGVTLERVNNEPDLTISFQDEIVMRKSQDELQALSSQDLWFTERTYVDLFTYALISLGNDNQYSEWLDSYYQICTAYQLNYTKVFYLNAGKFNVAHDGVRGSNQHYSKMVDLTMEHYTKEMSNTPPIVITEGDLNKRVDFIINNVV